MELIEDIAIVIRNRKPDEEINQNHWNIQMHKLKHLRISIMR